MNRLICVMLSIDAYFEREKIKKYLGRGQGIHSKLPIVRCCMSNIYSSGLLDWTSFKVGTDTLFCYHCGQLAELCGLLHCAKE